MVNFFKRLVKGVSRGVSKAAGVALGVAKGVSKPVEKLANTGLRVMGEKTGATAFVKELLPEARTLSNDFMNSLPPSVRSAVGNSVVLAPLREDITNNIKIAEVLAGERELTMSDMEDLFPVVGIIMSSLRIAKDFPERKKEKVQKRLKREVMQIFEHMFTFSPIASAPLHLLKHAVDGR